MNIYLQDDLAASVKRAGLEVSAICQAALREAVTAKEQGVGTQIESLKAAMRLRRTTRQGRHAVGVSDGIRWARGTATAKDLETIALVEIEVLKDGDDDEEPMYMARWIEHGTSSNQLELVGVGFSTLAPWLAENGSTPLYEADDEISVEADEYLAGFVSSAQSVWRELRPLIDEDESVLRRRIDLLQDMERTMLVQGTTAEPPATTGAVESST